MILFACGLLSGCAANRSNETAAPLTPQELQAQKIIDLQRATTANPNDSAAHYTLGNALFDAQRYAEAKDAYQRAVTLKPDYAAAYCNMGLCLRVLGHHQEALDAYHRALELEPDDPISLSNFVAGLQMTGDTDAAFETLRKVAALRPDDPLIRSEFANLLFRRNDYAAAAREFQEVIRIDPGRSADYYNLGLCQMELGALDDALTTWLTAIAYDPDNASVRKGLAVLYWRRGEYQEAWKAVVDCQSRGIFLDADFLSALQRDSGQAGPES